MKTEAEIREKKAQLSELFDSLVDSDEFPDAWEVNSQIQMILWILEEY